MKHITFVEVIANEKKLVAGYLAAIMDLTQGGTFCKRGLRDFSLHLASLADKCFQVLRGDAFRL